jgi:hypothetical protein
LPGKSRGGWRKRHEKSKEQNTPHGKDDTLPKKFFYGNEKPEKSGKTLN